MHALHPFEQDRESRLIEPDQTLEDDGPEPDEAPTVILTFRVPNELDGQRLDRFLEWRIPRLDRERAREIILACARTEDGRSREPWERVRSGETVRLERERFKEPDAPRTFGILYQDDCVLVVDKPAGLPVHPSATYHNNTLTVLLRERFGVPTPQLAHRLDKETSGIVVCGLPGPDDAALKKQFEQRTIKKTYLAVVRGVVEKDSFRIDLPLRRATSGLHLCVEGHPDGQDAVTEVFVLERRADRTLVRLEPQTGRQHQLRVHMASVGHPMLGDKLYGPGAKEIFLSIAENGLTADGLATLGHTRHALHASKLEFKHPRTGERCVVESPLPPDLVELLNAR